MNLFVVLVDVLDALVDGLGVEDAAGAPPVLLLGLLALGADPDHGRL